LRSSARPSRSASMNRSHSRESRSWPASDRQAHATAQPRPRRAVAWLCRAKLDAQRVPASPLASGRAALGLTNRTAATSSSHCWAKTSIHRLTRTNPDLAESEDLDASEERGWLCAEENSQPPSRKGPEKDLARKKRPSQRLTDRRNDGLKSRPRAGLFPGEDDGRSTDPAIKGVTFLLANCARRGPAPPWLAAHGNGAPIDAALGVLVPVTLYRRGVRVSTRGRSWRLRGA
jgi:hypothetical protein